MSLVKNFKIYEGWKFYSLV